MKISNSTEFEQPPITIAIPAFNEEDYIKGVIERFLESKYPNLEEILVADGGSTDNTRKIVKELSKKDSRVRLVDNPKKYQSFALNRMIEEAKGDVFIRADAHCEYGVDYLEKCIENLQIEGVKNAGGAARFLASNLVQAGTSLAVLSFLGHGGAKHYDPTYEGYSDTVPMGCFWLKDLKKLGGFNEENLTNQDAEINYRLRTHLEGKIYISPKIKLWYYPREKVLGLFKQYFRYGRGRCITSNSHSGKIPIRSKAPFIFILVILTSLLIDWTIFNGTLGLRYCLLIIGLIVISESIRLTYKKRNYFKEEVWQKGDDVRPSLMVVCLMSFIALNIMNFAHFLGYGYQLIKSKVFRIDGW